MTHDDTLAIDGGEPVRSSPMPPRLALGSSERAMVQQCLDYYAERKEDPGYQGYFEELYTDKFISFMGGEGHADAVATGTAALYIAIAALDLPKESEVLVSPITDPGTLNAIILNGLKPRLIDSMPGSYNVGIDEFTERVTPNVTGAVLVHAIGQACNIDSIVTAAHTKGIKVLEDCSQAHGAIWKGRQVGTFGDIAAFSTMYRKAHITGASGGVVYARDLDIHRQALAHADRGKARWMEGFNDRNPNTFLFPALNLHTDELSCAIGISSIGQLTRTIERRLEFIEHLSCRMIQENMLCKPYDYTPYDSPFVYPIIVDTNKISCNKIQFANALKAEGIGLNPHYQYLVSEWSWIQPYLADTFATPNAKAIRDSSFNLYLNENYGDQEVDDIILAMKKVERHFHA